ncbi:MAG TPA: hypothetical protein VG297_06680 [Bryobacteraceae bacterium]|jgi:hypothetical protein|nr:hypothetical protein [Bryobacteraceae bacterium]
MAFRTYRWTYCLSLSVLLAVTAGATSVPSLTFEELTDQSELVVSGQITRTWSDWDSEGKFIWTHHELAVASTQKGAAESTVIVSEPGGIVGDRGMSIAGAVTYRPGEQVVVFLQRMPNGYLRTAGWGQGKYTVDSASRLHPGNLGSEGSMRSLELVPADRGVQSTARGTSLGSLEGISIADLRTRVAARVAAQRQRSTK